MAAACSPSTNLPLRVSGGYRRTINIVPASKQRLMSGFKRTRSGEAKFTGNTEVRDSRWWGRSQPRRVPRPHTIDTISWSLRRFCAKQSSNGNSLGSNAAAPRRHSVHSSVWLPANATKRFDLCLLLRARNDISVGAILSDVLWLQLHAAEDGCVVFSCLCTVDIVLAMNSGFSGGGGV